jgi:MoaA/NifB/PqqE/SkfB family radical SAM enzyme
MTTLKSEILLPRSASGRVAHEVRVLRCHYPKVFERLVASGTAELREIPPCIISIDLNYLCPMSCPGCIAGIDLPPDPRQMPWDMLKDILDCARRWRAAIETIEREPMTYAHLDAFLDEVARLLIPLFMVTSGFGMDAHLESLERAFKVPGSRARISMNAPPQKYAEEYGRSDGEELARLLLRNIERLASRKVGLRVSTLLRPDPALFPDVEEIVRLGKESGATSVLLIPKRTPDERRVLPYRELLGQIGDFTAALKARFSSGGFKVILAGTFDSGSHPGGARRCWCSLVRPLITPRGEIMICTNLRRRADPLAIIGGSFEEAWASRERIERFLGFGCSFCTSPDCNRWRINAAIEVLREAHEKDPDGFDRDLAELIPEDSVAPDDVWF